MTVRKDALDVSVVMVTYNRRAILRRTLLLYNDQVDMLGRFEIVLVDDGSTDGTIDMIEALRSELRYPLSLLVLAANDGPAKSRNQAIDASRGTVVFLTGDDVLPTPALLAGHWDWHANRYADDRVAVLGRVAWHPELDATPLLQWLETSGDQFAYGDIENGDIVPYSRLYTSNVSFKRRFLIGSGERLDERLHYGFEDSEWGLRLSRKGLVLRYNAAAIGHHLHPTTLASSLRRSKSIGASAATLRSINADEFHRVTAGLFTPERRWRRLLAGVLLNPVFAKAVYTPLARLCERRIVADRVYAAAHMSAMMAGLRESGVALVADGFLSRVADHPSRPTSSGRTGDSHARQ